jgi:hypothetical protein
MPSVFSLLKKKKTKKLKKIGKRKEKLKWSVSIGLYVHQGIKYISYEELK